MENYKGLETVLLWEPEMTEYGTTKHIYSCGDIDSEWWEGVDGQD